MELEDNGEAIRIRIGSPSAVTMSGENSIEALAEIPPPNPREHQWSNRVSTEWQSCEVCGIVRRADDKNKPCGGPVSISFRTEPDPRDEALRVAEQWLVDLWKVVPEKIDARMKYREVQFSDSGIGELYDRIIAIRAALEVGR